jgi:hypothetical protein
MFGSFECSTAAGCDEIQGQTAAGNLVCTLVVMKPTPWIAI